MEIGRTLGATLDSLNEADRVGFLQRIKAWVDDEIGQQVYSSYPCSTLPSPFRLLFQDFAKPPTSRLLPLKYAERRCRQENSRQHMGGPASNGATALATARPHLLAAQSQQYAIPPRFTADPLDGLFNSHVSDAESRLNLAAAYAGLESIAADASASSSASSSSASL